MVGLLLAIGVSAQTFEPLTVPDESFRVPQGVFAEMLDSVPSGREGRQELSLSVAEDDDDTMTVLLTISGLPDDSVAAEQRRAIMRYGDGGWRAIEVGKRWRCQPGRGPEDWTTSLCN